MAHRVSTAAPLPAGVGEACRSLGAAVDRAAAACPALVHESWYRIAGQDVALRLVGAELTRRLTPALAHLRVAAPAGPPALRIDAFDQRETGIPCPLPDPGLEPDSPGLIAASPDGRAVLMQRAHLVTGFDRVSRQLRGAVADAAGLTQYEVGRPWHSELLLWQRDRGLQPVHAGFIQRDGHGILLGGPGGSGKSTTALLCMDAGWDYLADDYVALESRPDGFVGHGLYCSSHLEPAHLQRFPALRSAAIPGQLAREDKSLLLLGGIAGTRLGSRAEIRALALPRVTGAPETRFRAASRGEALLRLAPSSLLLLPYQGLGHDGFRALTALVERVPVYWLELGSDFAQLPRGVDALLQDALARRP